MTSPSFVHLHTHTEYSMLDGAARVNDLVKLAKQDKQPAIAITDHGNMYGVLDFYDTCKAHGVSPIVGIEAYMAANSRLERPTRKGKIDDTGGDGERGEKLYYHLTLLAENTEGYKNLIKLSSTAFLEGYYYKPRVDFELLEKYHEGLIALTGCLGGLVNQALLAGNYPQARDTAVKLQDIFGKESLFVELQDHGLAEQKRTNPDLIKIAREVNAPIIATNDSHYCKRSDSVAHDALLCVQTGATITDPNRFHFDGEEHYLKTAVEMRELFADYPDACDNTLWIAERASVEIEPGVPTLPQFEVPPEFQKSTYEESSAAYLKHLTYEGAYERYSQPLVEEVKERLDYELDVIAKMGFSAYFLVVADLIRFAVSKGIRVGPGRGSAAGCCVAYCLKIVNIDPIRYGLIFERFLNPGRKSMPDIDMDFDERYRSDMIAYASERYGWDRVAQIVTFSTIKARAAVRDAARVLGYPYILGDRIAKAMPPVVMGRDTPLSACLELDEKHEDGYKGAASLREMYEQDPEAKRVIDVAKGLEGLRRQDGIHAAAVVITNEPLTEYLPIQRKPEPNGDPENAPIVTQYEMTGVERLGLLKMDFLGLRNLSVIDVALKLIEQTRGTKPDIDNIALDDEATYEMLRRGDSIGVFQLEGTAMRSLMRSLAPTCFDDVAALVALYRPGPMAANMHKDYADRKNGRKPIEYLHQDLKEILPEYGLMIYQESMMRVAQRFAGYSLAEADNLRKACGKKNRDLIAKERQKFVDGCVATGYGKDLGTKIFDIIEPFANYAFNKSHAYGYGLVSYQTAWLKANYPVEYLAALLSSVKDDKDKMAVYLAECRTMQIEVLVPDVNTSTSDFSPYVPAKKQESGSQRDRKAIVFGLSAIRNVGQGVVQQILDERQKDTFRDFYDFCNRVDPSVLNKRAVESLIKAGAFDAMGHPRKGLLLGYEDIIEKALQKRREEKQGVATLFSLFEDMATAETGFESSATHDALRGSIADVEFSKSEKLTFEKEMLGLYVSDHPLKGFENQLSKLTDMGIREFVEKNSLSEENENFVPSEDSSANSYVRLGGVVTALSRRYTKKGDFMATFTLEDLDSALDVFVFPKAMAEVGTKLEEDRIVVVKGRADLRDDTLKLVCQDVVRPEFHVGDAFPVKINLPIRNATEKTIAELKTLIADYPGDSPVLLLLGEKVLRLTNDFTVDPSSGFLAGIKELLGANAITDTIW
ncbi:MAG: DNA polymerase III subunit alpha [Firmicutes bacterium]|nr:DNA polymerase III subunit alpha [Bacillota bacterium]